MYTVTTTKPGVTTRQRVPTLTDARAACLDVLMNYSIREAASVYEQISHDGGHIGPLPDGTTIDVEAS